MIELVLPYFFVEPARPLPVDIHIKSKGYGNAVMDCGEHFIGETVINGEVKGQLVVGIGYGKFRDSRLLGIKLMRRKYAGKQE